MSNFLCLIKPLTSNGAQVLFLQASLLKLLPEVVLTILNHFPNEQVAPKILDRPRHAIKQFLHSITPHRKSNTNMAERSSVMCKIQ